MSIDAPSNYPDFEDLAIQIGGAAFPRQKNELIDRYLGRLEQEGLPVHDRVRQRLSNPDSRPNHLHQVIVRLFGAVDAIRIVTTNFDDHFRGAATNVFGSPPEIYRAPALPLGDAFKGIVHLHGSVRDDAKNLILTDADFGRAYLTQGWARRFVQRLFAEFVVLFVGYSHQDLPLLYLARGISAAAGGPGRYALTSPTSDTDWLNLGITPVHYLLRADPLPRYGALGDCLAKWAEITNLGSLGTEAEIRRIVTSDRPESPEDYVLPCWFLNIPDACVPVVCPIESKAVLPVSFGRNVKVNTSLLTPEQIWRGRKHGGKGAACRFDSGEA